VSEHDIFKVNPRMPKKVRLADIVMRDGFQHEEIWIPTEAKIYYLQELAFAGVKRLEVTNLGSPRVMPQFKDADEVLKTLIPNEIEVREKSGLWFLLRIMPYRTIENVIDGVVITFLDITGQKRVQNELNDALNYSEGILNTIRESLVVLDADLRIISANHSFYRTFQVSSQESVGSLIFDLGNRHQRPAMGAGLDQLEFPRFLGRIGILGRRKQRPDA